MLVQRRRRWPNIKPTYGGRFMKFLLCHQNYILNIVLVKYILLVKYWHVNDKDRHNNIMSIYIFF